MFNFFKKKEQHPENGLHTVFFKDGKKKSEINYKNGMKNGQATCWHNNGQKAEECVLKNESVEGNYSSWYSNGQKEEEYSMNNGKFTGNYASWHKNGQLSIKGDYTISGKEDGFFTSWDKKGRVEENEYFVYGWSMFKIDHEITEKEVLENFKDILNTTKEKRFKKGYKEILEIRVDQLKNKLGEG